MGGPQFSEEKGVYGRQVKREEVGGRTGRRGEGEGKLLCVIRLRKLINKKYFSYKGMYNVLSSVC